MRSTSESKLCIVRLALALSHLRGGLYIWVLHGSGCFQAKAGYRRSCEMRRRACISFGAIVSHLSPLPGRSLHLDYLVRLLTSGLNLAREFRQIYTASLADFPLTTPTAEPLQLRCAPDVVLPVSRCTYLAMAAALAKRHRPKAQNAQSVRHLASFLPPFSQAAFVRRRPAVCRSNVVE